MDMARLLLLTMLLCTTRAKWLEPFLPINSSRLLAIHEKTLYVSSSTSLYQLNQNLRIEVAFTNSNASSSPSTAPFVLKSIRGLGLLSCGLSSGDNCRLHQFGNISESSVVDVRWFGSDRNQSSMVVAEFPNSALPDPMLLMSYSSAVYRSRLECGHDSCHLEITAMQPDYEFLLSSNDTFQSTKRLFAAVLGRSGAAYGYVVSVQPSWKHTSEVTRLSRVCDRLDLSPSSYAHSYMEMTLRCGEGHAVAQAVYLHNNSMFYVAFASDSDRPATAICAFSLDDIDHRFETSFEECKKGLGAKNWQFEGQPWSGACSSGSDSMMKQISCSTRMSALANIDADELNADPIFTMSGVTATHIDVWDRDGSDRPALLLGTKEGSVIKTSFNSSRADFKYELQGERDKDVRAMQRVDDTLFVVTASGIHSLPLRSCRVYQRDFKACVSAHVDAPRGRLECGWCREGCGSKDECVHNWQREHCSPIIYSIHPAMALVDEDLQVHIDGACFGTSTDDVAVTFGTRKCENTRVKMDQITCHLLAASDVDTVDVKVTAHPTSLDGVSIKSEEMQRFEYVKPTVSGVDLSWRSAGMDVVITGQHLSLGSNLTVLLAGVPCAVQRRNDTAIVCVSQASPGSWSAVHNGSVRIQMNVRSFPFEQLRFQYVEPVVTRLSPRRGFVSGGTAFRVEGHYLWLPQVTTVVFSVFVDGTWASQSASCHHVRGHDTQLECRVPNMASEVQRVRWIPADHLEAHVTFLMDGTRYNGPAQPFQLYPDPKYFNLTEAERVQHLTVGAQLLVLKGSDLNTSHGAADVSVTIGPYPCLVDSLTATELRCRPRTEDFASPRWSATPLPVTVMVGNLNFSVGTLSLELRPQSDSKLSDWTVLGIVVVVAALVLVIVMVLLSRCCPRCFQLKKKKELERWLYTLMSKWRRERSIDDAIQMNPDCVVEGSLVPFQLPELKGNPIYVEQRLHLGNAIHKKLSEFDRLIDRECIELGEAVGKGHFSEVHRGFLMVQVDQQQCRMEVAVKMLHPGSTDPANIERFIEEGLIMCKFNHENVLSLIGICLPESMEPMVVLPFMVNGDLRSFVRDSHNNPTLSQLMTFGVEVARGMAYLCDAKFVHRDLAARNCMLDDQLRVKIADFGLSRDVYTKDYYRMGDISSSQLPMRWMAPESIRCATFTSKTDVVGLRVSPAVSTGLSS